MNFLHNCSRTMFYLYNFKAMELIFPAWSLSFHHGYKPTNMYFNSKHDILYMFSDIELTDKNTPKNFLFGNLGLGLQKFEIILWALFFTLNPISDQFAGLCKWIFLSIYLYIFIFSAKNLDIKHIILFVFRVVH